MSDTETPASSPYHAGEQAMQARAGVRERAELMGRRMIRDFMPDQHREFFAMLPWLLVGSLDAQDRPWASVLVGPPGFIASPDPRSLEIAARPLAGDPLAAHLRAGVPLGLLGLQPETRRRNRMNGVVSATWPGGFAMTVGQSFGNCPQYIQARAPIFVAAQAEADVRAESARLSEAAVALIDRADTFFIATAGPGARAGRVAEGVDVSHRGGRPGFVKVTEVAGRGVLTAPDFAGNNAFNTLGNIATNPRAGITFVDFASGDLLLLTGTAEVVWDGPEVASFAGALRLLRFTVAEGVFLAQALPLRWSVPEYAPQLARTGAWSG